MFRQTVVNRLSSPEELDRLMHVTSPRSWLILVILFLSLLAGGLWLAFTYIPTTVSAQGALARASGASRSPGHVHAIVYVSPGQADEIVRGMQAKVQVRHNGGVVSFPGTVETVHDFAVTQREMTAVVRNEAFARSLAASGDVLPVDVDLTGAQARNLPPGLLARATITLTKQQALKLVVP